MTGGGDPIDDPLIDALRTAGCVYAEDEARILRDAATDADELDRMLARRVAGEPLEPVVGWVEFAGMRVPVGPGVFVPRQRTRLLADAAVDAVRDAGRSPVFVEAFAGAGPLAAVVHAAAPEAEIHVTDIDAEPLEYAHRHLPAAAGIHVGSVLGGLPADLRGRVDVIAAVPPYVPDGEAAFLPREARDFEPVAALFGGEDGLDLVRALIGAASAWLRPPGRLLIEMNHEQCADAAVHGERHGFDARVVRGDDGQTAVLVLEGGGGPWIGDSTIFAESPV